MELRNQLFINGEYVNSSDGGTIEVLNPATNKTITKVQKATPADLKKAIDAAQKATDETWGKMSPFERSALLHKVGEAIENNAEFLAQLEADDVGKPIFEAVNIPTVNHICGATDMIIEQMHECGATALSVDQKNNVALTREKLGNDVLLLGNFDPYGTLCQMEAADAAKVVEQCIDAGVDAVWPGCDLWPDVKKENVDAYVKTTHEYGKKASPAVGRA